jgi:hypothetical protein
MARITFASAPIFRVWSDGTADQLPTPPGYQLPSGHCGEWDQWIRTTPTIYFDNPATDLRLQAGQSDIVLISKIEVQIYRRTARTIGSGTWIKCNWGGGSDVFYNVKVDTVKRTTTVQEQNLDSADEQTFEMPPRSIGLSDKGHQEARIFVQSQPGYRYEGALVISATVNGKDVTYTVGSRDKPVRWITDGSAEVDGAPGTTYYGWDQRQRRWIREFQPFDQ